MGRVAILFLALAFLLFAPTTVTATITHSFDLADQLTSPLAIMLDMAWFGIPADPQGNGQDGDWGNWAYGHKGCVVYNDPTACNESPLPAFRSDGSPRSLSRIDLMLSNVRRPCDSGARIDVWAPQINSMQWTSLHVAHPLNSLEYPYRALLGFIARANAHGVKNAVTASMDGTWMFHFGNGSGRGISGKAACMAEITKDIVDIVNILNAGGDAVRRVNGKPFLSIYIDAALAGPSDWKTALDNARNILNSDFYVSANTGSAAFFEAFDAISPWLPNTGWWNSATVQSQPTVELKGAALAKAEHQPLFDALKANPVLYKGRMVFGGSGPGFDDYTKHWGNPCEDRIIPRDPAYFKGQFDYFKSVGIKGLTFQTWNDWTEGSHMEPDVVGGVSVLVQARQLLGDLFGEPADTAGDNRLVQRWTSYGQMRNCKPGPIGIPPVVDLSCSPATTHPPATSPKPTTAPPKTTTPPPKTTTPPPKTTTPPPKTTTPPPKTTTPPPKTTTAAPPPSYSNTIFATPGLIAYYRLDELSGIAAHDLAGSDNVGTIAGSMTYGVKGALVGSTNTAFSFTAGSVSVPGLASSLLTSSGITIEAWAAISPSVKWGGIAGFRSATQAFYVNTVSPTALEIRFINSAGKGFQLSPAISSSVWHHIVVTYNHATYAAYIDGALVASAAATGGLSDGTLTFWIGKDGLGNALIGSVDEVAVYTVALTAAQVQTHYSVGHGTAAAAGTRVQLAVSTTGKRRDDGSAAGLTQDEVDQIVSTLADFTDEPATRFVALPLAPPFDGVQVLELHITDDAEGVHHSKVAATVVQHASSVVPNLLSASSSPAPGGSGSYSPGLPPAVIAVIVISSLIGLVLLVAGVAFAVKLTRGAKKDSKAYKSLDEK